MFKGRVDNPDRSGIFGWNTRGRGYALSALLPALTLGGCVSDAEFLAQNSGSALKTVESRARFELNCDQARATILSQKIIESMPVGGYYGWRGAVTMAGPWTEYTIGARGCGKEAVYMTVCRDENNCSAFSQTANVLNSQ